MAQHSYVQSRVLYQSSIQAPQLFVLFSAVVHNWDYGERGIQG